MKATDYWQLFLKTGSPEAYLLYSSARKAEEMHVLDHSGYCPQSNRLQ